MNPLCRYGYRFSGCYHSKVRQQEYKRVFFRLIIQMQALNFHRKFSCDLQLPAVKESSRKFRLKILIMIYHILNLVRACDDRQIEFRIV